MSDAQELTPKEKYHASLYKDPQRLFRRALMHKLAFLIPSAVMMVVWLVTRDPAYAMVGYGILFYQAVYGIVLMKRGIGTTNRLLTKYEAKGQGNQNAV